MRIKKVDIEYFKFIEKLPLELEIKNCLIYGENGSGKSSIYEAIYSIFYHQKRIRENKAISISKIFKNRNYKKEDLKVKIFFDLDEKVISRINEEVENLEILPSTSLKINKKYLLYKATLLCANEKVFNKLVKENFYIAIKETLLEHFSNDISLLSKNYKEFEDLDIIKNKMIEKIEKIEKKNKKEITDFDFKLRIELEKELELRNNIFDGLFKKIIPIDEINNILRKKFKENIKIEFEIEKAYLSADRELIYNPPFIRIIINNSKIEDKLHFHYNEAKLKLISLAIYFAIAKKYEHEKGFNLLVLDDFLTSLDMANRKLIVQYILEDFKNYQKIILTHNIQFYDIINNLIKHNKQESDWSFKTIFNFENRAYIKNENVNYIDEAKKYLYSPESYDLQATGVYLRKEFEYICQEFEKLLNLGKKEKLQNIIDSLKSDEKYFSNPHKRINKFIAHFEATKNNSCIGDSKKLDIIAKKIKELENSEPNDEIKFGVKELEFYKDILLNSTAHNDKTNDIFRKECESTIKLLEILNKELNSLK